MIKIHDDAHPVIIEGSRQVGWYFENEDFAYHAIDRGVEVKVYVTWHKRDSVEDTWFSDWEGVQQYLAILLEGK